jgi:predicted ATPase
LPEHYPRLTLTPQKQKEKTQQAGLALLLQETTRQPVRFDVEDVHWADPSTLEFLSLLIERAVAARLFVLVTFRPDFTPPWALTSHVTQLSLRRLGRKQVETMVERLAGDKTLSGEIIQQLITRTDGVPLFVEELTKNAIEAVGVHSGPLAIPTTLHDSLMARLDRMSTAKEVAQLGAAIGREFSYDLLRAVSRFDEANLQQSLKKLVEAELLYQRGTPPQSRYLFKHALIQDAAYQSLLNSTRQQYHKQIARALEEQFPETKDTQPELLAQHYTEAGIAEQAIPYWQQAGQRAGQRSANIEAISHLTKALEALKTLPDTPDRVEQELMLQIALGVPLRVTKGFSASEVGKTYARARELSQRTGETSQLFPVLRGLWEFYELQGELQTAREIGEQLLTLAQHVQDPSLLLVAHDVMGDTLVWLGEFVTAREHLEQGIALYDAQQHRDLAFLYGYDSGMACLSFAALALWYLGYPDQALERSNESIILARELSYPPNVVFSLSFAAELHPLRQEVRAAQERAEAAITLSTEQEFPLFLAWGTIMQGWALAEQGQVEEGVAQIRQGLAAWRATGAELMRSQFLAMLAEAYGKVRQAKEGLAALAEALTVVDQSGERFYESELYRLRGELTLAQSNVQSLGSSVQKEAEGCFLKAIEIARKQQAKSLELRAVMSLVRLRQQQVTDHSSRNTQHESRSALAEARKMLSEVYNWFTEGFDTKDLQEAKALIEELSH